MHLLKNAPRIYISRLQRALRYARACLNRLNKHGADKRYRKSREHFDDAKQRFCSLQYSPLLSEREKASVLSCAMGLAALMEQIEAKVLDATDRTNKLPGGSPPALGVENDSHDSQQPV